MKEVVSSPSGHVPGVDSFLDISVNNYTKYDEFFGSFLTNLFKAYVEKVDGVPNPRYGIDALIFFLALSESGNKKAFEFVSGNICGVSLRWIKKITEKRRSAPSIGIFLDEIIDLILARIIQIHMVRKDLKFRFAFTAGIYTTDLVKAYQVSMSNNAIVGGSSPNYFIPVNCLSK